MGQGASAATRESFRKKLRAGELSESPVEIEVEDASPPMGNLDIPGQPVVGVVNLGEIFGKAFGRRTKRVRMTVSEAYEPLVREESDKLVDQDALVKEALALTAEERRRVIDLEGFDEAEAIVQQLSIDERRAIVRPWAWPRT